MATWWYDGADDDGDDRRWRATMVAIQGNGDNMTMSGDDDVMTMIGWWRSGGVVSGFVVRRLVDPWRMICGRAPGCTMMTYRRDRPSYGDRSYDDDERAMMTGMSRAMTTTTLQAYRTDKLTVRARPG